VSIEDQLTDWLRQGLVAAAPALGLDPQALPAPQLLAPKQKDHGDFATNVALALAKPAGKPPREVAQVLVDALASAPFVEKVEIAGPGFLNVFTTDDWLHETVRTIAAAGERYGRAELTESRVQVEFVSSNPTGPLTIGHARNAAIGDALASLLEHQGWLVEREYYFNDAGGQMDRFGRSVEARLLQLLGRDAELPDDGYRGDYVADIARDIMDTEGPGIADLPEDERFARLRDLGAQRILTGIRATLDRFGVRFDVYRSERELAEAGEIDEAVRRLRDAGYIVEADGAVWFRSTAFGDDKDRVVIRSNGVHTYFAADCAYVIDKFGRGFDHVIYVWGADHHGDVARVKGAAQALGFDPDAVEMVLYQFVAFLRDGEPVKMSTRAGAFITLDELIDEVGTDAARFTLLQFSNDSAVNFDIEVVKQQTMENPVYYVQYGHARIASILRKAAERGVAMGSVDAAELGLLRTDAEAELLRSLADIPGVIAGAARQRAPHRLTHAALDLAGRFHRFYTECPVLSEDPALTQARLWLCSSTKQVIANLLGLLGVSAPESMDRSDD
jgi:arginyl-tRNA synthetase